MFWSFSAIFVTLHSVFVTWLIKLNGTFSSCFDWSAGYVMHDQHHHLRKMNPLLKPNYTTLIQCLCFERTVF